MKHTRTLSLIKPDAVALKITGKINTYIEEAGFKIKAQKMITLSNAQAESFYAEHKGRPFFNDLVSLMTSGSLIAQVLEKENCVEEYRNLIGNTDPQKAERGTIRGDLAEDISENRVHGSDANETAKREIAFFFSESELV